jgi:hypothetical protein
MSHDEGLQFERAEFESAPSAQCAGCNTPLRGFYFDVNGQTVCEACRYAIEAKRASGSALGRFGRAAGAGLGAAILGSALYYTIAAVTGYELGLIAIVVGFGVGTAVRWGSGGRGGWGYQTLAMALTYLAIVSTYIPPILEGFKENADESTVADSAQAGSSTAPATDAQPAAATAAGSPPPAAPVQVTQAGPMLTIAAVLILLAIACVAPFLAGAQNIMGIVIIGIGLYEAWKLNKRADLTITGPHALASAPAEVARL